MIKEYLDACAPDLGGSILTQLNHHCMKASIPLNVALELTMKCNFACHHCYNYDRSQPMPAPMRNSHLTREEILSLLSQLAEAGTLNITFTGGEALLNPHLVEFVGQSVQRHMVPRLKSNGALVTNEIAKQLREAGLFSLEISWYGASEESYSKFTGRKMSFEKALAGTQAAVDAGLNTTLSFVLHKGNYKEYPDMVKRAEEMGVSYGTSIDISVRNDWTRGSLNSRLGEQELAELFEMSDNEGFLEERPFDNLQCGCARLNCGISFEGNVYPCVGAPLKCGNIREKSFSDIWRNSEQLNWIRELGNKDFKDCLGCPVRRVCPRNSGVAFSNNGDYTAKDEWACMTANLIQETRERRGMKSSPPLAEPSQ